MAARGPFVALLRGINVGGHRPLPMADLRAAFGHAGFGSVGTYIQSGNVVFTAADAVAELETRIAALLAEGFGLDIPVVVRSVAQMRSVVADAPDGFGASPTTYHSDVVFLKPPLTSAAAMKVVSLHPEVDSAWPGAGVVYFQRLSARRTQSRLSKIMGTPEYAQMTIRNWNTTTRILSMLEAIA